MMPGLRRAAAPHAAAAAADRNRNWTVPAAWRESAPVP
jgi:hypothetical protein